MRTSRARWSQLFVPRWWAKDSEEIHTEENAAILAATSVADGTAKRLLAPWAQSSVRDSVREANEARASRGRSL